MTDPCFLLDFDGVIADTENTYTIFWNKIGADYINDPDFAYKIKGRSLSVIISTCFPDRSVYDEIMYKVDKFEETMPYPYIPGALEFLEYLHANKLKSAIVTSSNKSKMEHVFRVHPELLELVDKVFTAEDFTKSKPDPDCFLIGMKYFGATTANTIIFEDSFHGLAAARATGATVVALSTTNPKESLIDKADLIIPNFLDLSFISEKLLSDR